MSMQIKRLMRQIVSVAPVASMVGVAAFGIVSMLLLFIDRFETFFVWPLGLIAAVLAMIAVGRLPRIERPGSLRERQWVDVAALVAILLWGVWNVAFTSQHIFTNRDPATYANAAAWLVNHDSLRIEAPSFTDGLSGFTNSSPGFTAEDGSPTVSSQGQDFLPVLLAAAGKLVGEYKMLHTPVLIGMAALLAVYGFARLLVKPRWALLAVAVLGLTLPMLYFARDAYTEPLTMGLLFAGMTLVWTAFRAQRLSAWLLAGLVLGASTMVRIDVYITLAGIMLFVAIVLCGVPKADRKRTAWHVAAFLAVMAVFAALSFVDMTRFSLPYLVFHKKLIMQELLGFGAVLLVGASAVAFAWRSARSARWRRAFERWASVGGVLLVISGGLLLYSRPLWFTGQTHQQNADVAALQARRGLPVEPRSYTEQSVNWVAWYTGMPLMTLGLVGLGMGIANAKRQRVILLLGVSSVAVTGLVYFIHPSVAPDQIWASRRYVPMVLPGLLVFSMIPLAFLWEKYKDQLQIRQAFAVLLVGAVCLAPLTVSRPFIAQRDVVQTPIIEGVCGALPKNAAVLWVGDGQYYLVQPTRSFCGVPAFSFTSRTLDWAAISQAAAKVRAAGYVPVLAVMNGDKPILESQAHNVEMVSDFTFHEMEMRLTGPPRFAETKTLGVSIAEITEAGSLAPLQGTSHPGQAKE